MDNTKFVIIVNALKLVPFIVAGIEGAIEAHNKAMAALEGGITPEEQLAASQELDAVLQRIIDKTS